MGLRAAIRRLEPVLVRTKWPSDKTRVFPSAGGYLRSVPFLYGDGSPSPLELDYLGYLRRMMSLAVEVLLAEDLLVDAARRRRALRERTAKLEARLEALHATVRQAVDDLARSPEDDPVTHCANHIQGAVDEVVARQVAAVRAQDETAEAQIATRERKAHAACLDAVDGFLRAHDLPDAALEVELDARGSQPAALLLATTPYQIAAEIELDLHGSPLAAAEVRAGGLIRTRLRTVKLDRLLVVGARCRPGEIEVRLRAGRDAGAEGLDVVTDRATGAVRLVRRRGAEATPVATSSDDERGLAELASAVAAALAAPRARVRAVTVDDTPLDELERPSILVDRVFFAMAPQVRAIVEHSPIPGELSLRRDLGGGRREEIFVAHASLAALVDQVPAGRRGHFDVLGLPGIAARPPSGGGAEAAEPSEPSISIHAEDG
jgi:hypothetical protein